MFNSWVREIPWRRKWNSEPGPWHVLSNLFSQSYELEMIIIATLRIIKWKVREVREIAQDSSLVSELCVVRQVF